MKKIYLVKENIVGGAYIASFDSREYAYLFVGAFGGDLDIWEVDVNPNLSKIKRGLSYWLVGLDKDVDICTTQRYVWQLEKGDYVYRTFHDGSSIVYVWAKDAKHAESKARKMVALKADESSK